MKSGIVLLFGLTSFLAAALLFSVQPIIGKMVLPVLGGTPAVWTTCLVFFQVMLLVGYLFAHGAYHAEGSGIRSRGALYLSILALLWTVGYGIQPIKIGPETSTSLVGGAPAIGLLGLLGLSAALPLLMVSATAPLLQCWFALTPHRRARSVLPLCREQRRKLDRATGLPVLNRTSLRIEYAKPDLAVRFSCAGNSDALLSYHRAQDKPNDG